MALAYDEMIARQPDLSPVLREIRSWKGLDVLDLGAGSGRLSRVMASDARSLVCTDGSPHMLELLERKLAHAAVTRNWITKVADHRQLPFNDGSLDLVVAGWTIGYLANTDITDWHTNLSCILSEHHRVLRPDGTIIILETMGTGTETPQPPESLIPYYEALVNEYGFSQRTIRMDYRFDSPSEAQSHMAFFFGDSLAAKIEKLGWLTVPEWAGIWWKHE